MADISASSETPKTQNLLSPLRQLIPLVDSLSGGLRNISIFGMIVSAGLFTWAYFWMGWSLLPAALTGLLATLPTAVITRLWWGIFSLKRLPELARETLVEAADEAGADVKTALSDIRQRPAKALGLLTQFRNLWQLRGLLGDVDDWLAHGLNLSFVLNPFFLLLGAVSILILGILGLISLVLLIAALV